MGHNGHGINLYRVLKIPMEICTQGKLIMTGDSQSLYTGVNDTSRCGNRRKFVLILNSLHQQPSSAYVIFALAGLYKRILRRSIRATCNYFLKQQHGHYVDIMKCQQLCRHNTIMST